MEQIPALIKELSTINEAIYKNREAQNKNIVTIESEIIIQNTLASIINSSEFIKNNKGNILQNMISIRFIFEGLITSMLLNQDEEYVFKLYYDLLSSERKNIEYRKKQLEQEIKILESSTAKFSKNIAMTSEDILKQEEIELELFKEIIRDNFFIHTSYNDLYKNGLNYQIFCLKTEGISYYNNNLKELDDKEDQFFQDLKNHAKSFKNKSKEEIQKDFKKNRINWREKAKQVNLENEYDYIYGFSSSLSHFSGYSLLTSSTYDPQEEEMILTRLEIYLKNIKENINHYLKKHQLLPPATYTILLPKKRRTKMKELSPKYNPAEVEAGRYQKWLDVDVFKPSGDQKAKPYSIVIPPPNVTGKLHLGHAWDTTLQDIIIRQKRMQGFDTLWLPGMDHAGIATQAKVEERLRGEGITRYDLGREKFLDKVWEWKDEYATTIKEQWGKMGLSVDYSRERFTLDEGLSKAVRKVFVDLYKKGWIYRGEALNELSGFAAECWIAAEQQISSEKHYELLCELFEGLPRDAYDTVITQLSEAGILTVRTVDDPLYTDPEPAELDAADPDAAASEEGVPGSEIAAEDTAEDADGTPAGDTTKNAEATE